LKRLKKGKIARTTTLTQISSIVLCSDRGNGVGKGKGCDPKTEEPIWKGNRKKQTLTKIANASSRAEWRPHNRYK
jgi:hypothetical protein